MCVLCALRDQSSSLDTMPCIDMESIVMGWTMLEAQTSWPLSLEHVAPRERPSCPAVHPSIQRHKCYASCAGRPSSTVPFNASTPECSHPARKT